MKWIEGIEDRKEPMSAKEAAKAYGDSISSFYRKVRRGEIPGVFREPGKPRSRIKICPTDFAAWLRSRIEISGNPEKVKTSIPVKTLNVVHDGPPQDGFEMSGAEQAIKEVPRAARR